MTSGFAAIWEVLLGQLEYQKSLTAIATENWGNEVLAHRRTQERITVLINRLFTAERILEVMELEFMFVKCLNCNATMIRAKCDVDKFGDNTECSYCGSCQTENINLEIMLAGLG